MLTETQISHEEMKELVKRGALCAECQGLLTVAWSASENCYILRCGTNINHAGITGHNLKEERKRREYLSMDSTALMTMGTTKMLQRVEMARFPQELTVADKRLLAEVAITYGFDPLMGEVTIYQGHPFVSIDGRFRKAQETGQLDGVETRPATKQEREDWQIPEGDYFFRAEVWVKGSSRPFVAWGRVRKSETTGGKGFKPVETNPQRMAEKRAEAQALRKAFHIPLPNVEDIGSPEYDIESTAVDAETGEIIEQKDEANPSLEPPQWTRSEVADTGNGNLPVEGIEEAPPKDSVDQVWLDETLGAIRWKVETAKSWIKAQFKVPVEGTLMEVLNSLPEKQRKQFVEHIRLMRESSVAK